MNVARNDQARLERMIRKTIRAIDQSAKLLRQTRILLQQYSRSSPLRIKRPENRTGQIFDDRLELLAETLELASQTPQVSVQLVLIGVTEIGVLFRAHDRIVGFPGGLGSASLLFCVACI